MKIDSTVVIPALFIASYSLVSLLALGGKLLDCAFRKLDDGRRVTLERNECPRCKRVETTGHRPFDPDLCIYFVTSFQPCLACRRAANESIELDLDAVSLDTIRRLDPEYRSDGPTRDAAA